VKPPSAVGVADILDWALTEPEGGTAALFQT
jgi:hypothetical protein